MLLQRSGGHSLDVIVPSEYFGPASKFYRYSHVLDVSAHMPRIRKLFLHRNHGRNDVKHIVKIFSEPAPNLTHLGLVASLPHEEPISFPSLFGLKLPKLRVLKVRGVDGWPEIVGVNLTRITINYFLIPRVLKRCIPYSPNLEVLKIHGIWDFDEPDSTAWQRITLPPGIRLVVKHSRACPRILALFALPRDGHLKVRPLMYSIPDKPLLSYVLPTEISHFQNMHKLTRLHIKVRIGVDVALGLEWFRLDQPAFELSVLYTSESRTMMVQQGASSVMWLLGTLRHDVLRGVEELRMEGFIKSLEPQGTGFLTFLKGMPALTRLITTDGNEETLRSALDSLGCRAVVVRVEP
jgi:hypothetical protein